MNFDNNVRTLADLNKNISISKTSNNESVFNSTSGQTLSGNTVNSQVEPDLNIIRDALEKLLDENRKYLAENGNSTYDESFPNREISGIENINSEGIFEIVRNIFLDISKNGLNIPFGSDPNSISLTNLIAQHSNNQPLINNSLDNLNNSLILSRLNLPQLTNWREITLGDIADRISTLHLTLNNVESVEFLAYKVIPMGLVYNLLMKNFVKQLEKHSELESKVYPRKDLQHLLKVRLSILCLMGGIVIPVTSMFISEFSKSSIFETFRIKLISHPTAESLINIPLILYNKLNKETEGKKEVNNTNNKKFNFLRGWGKWFIFIILVFLEYKFDLLKTINSSGTFYVVAYFIYILISISLVVNSLAILILSLENNIELDESKFKFKWIIKAINSYFALKNSNVDPKVLYDLKLEHITYLKITLFVLFTLPLLIWIH